MEVAELFVNLGIKGTDKTVGALSGVKKELGNVKSESLAAKAAIVGVIYWLTKMFDEAGRRGAGLKAFETLTGVSAQTLQKYQWAAQQVNVSNAEVENSFKSLQSTMMKMATGQGGPVGAFARISETLHRNFTQADIAGFAAHPEKLIQVLQEYIALEPNVARANEVMSQMGVGDGMTTAMRRKAFTQENLDKAPLLSEQQIDKLDSLLAKLQNLKQEIMMAFEGFAAEHGDQLLSDIKIITDAVINLSKALVELAEKFHVFEKIGKTFNWLADNKERGEKLQKEVDKIQADPKLSFWEKAQKVDEATQRAQDEALKKLGLTDALKSHLDKSGAPAAVSGFLDKLVPNKAWRDQKDHEILEKVHEVAPGLTVWLRSMGALLQHQMQQLGKPLDVHKNTPHAPTAPPRAPGASGARERLEGPLPGESHYEMIQRLIREGKVDVGTPGDPGAHGQRPEGLAPGVGQAPRPPAMPSTSAIARPAAPVAALGGKSASQQNDVALTLNFGHDGKNAQQVADSTRKAITHAYRQMAAQGQVT